MDNPFSTFAARHLRYLAARSRALHRPGCSARSLVRARYSGDKSILSTERKLVQNRSRTTTGIRASRARGLGKLGARRTRTLPQSPASLQQSTIASSRLDIIKFPTPASNSNQQTSPVLRIVKTLIVAFPLLLGIAWAVCGFLTLWYAGDHFIGMHPLMFFAVIASPVVVVVGGGLGLALRWYSMIATSFFGALLVMLPLLSGYYVMRLSWQSSLAAYSAQNQAAITNTHFDSAHIVRDIPTRYSQMQPIVGFGWHSEQHIAAPNGQFRGFVINSVPHVYVQKERYAFRGVAWVEDPKLLRAKDVRYEYSGIDKWYTWEEAR